MRKVMILTASIGGGHNQAAKALKDIHRFHGYEVIVVDFLKETGKFIEKTLITGNSILYGKLPYIYKSLYKYSNNEVVNTKISNYAMKIFEKKIYNKIIKENPDLIIGTHPFTVNTICKLKKKRSLNLPFISVITDFKAHSFHVNRYVDAYITASEYTKIDMINRGVKKEKIYPYGIPIKQDFFKQKINRRYNDKKFTVLIMGGSIGSSSIESVLNELVKCKHIFKIIVVCGKNKALMNSIEVNYKDKAYDKEILLYGFTNNIPELMQKSDVLISKPGGLTVAEAIASNLPMIIPHMLPGQEEENAEFLVRSGAAMVMYNIESIKKEIDYLIERPYLLKMMEKNMRQLFTGHSLEKTVEISNRLINRYDAINYSYKKVK